MTKDEVIALARESTFTDRAIFNFQDDLVRFAALVAAKERDACADLCSAQVQIEKYGHAAHAALMCEQAIRARDRQ